MEIAFSLGSNLGDSLEYILDARDGLQECLRTVCAEWSCLYETEPVDVGDAYKDIPFLNAIVIVETACEVRECLAVCGELEHRAGRVRTMERNAPRTLDVDIIYADEMEMDDDDLTIPHPRWAQRRFILQPLAELRPDLILPGVHENVRKLLDNLQGNDKVRCFMTDW